MTKRDQKQLISHRLKIIRGHLDKVIKMVAADAYCMDILQQSLAVGSALKQVEEQVLEGHLRTCVKEALTDKSKADEKIEEMVKMLRAKR